MASKGLNLVEKNMSLLKEGDNTLIGNINGIQKSFKAFVKDGKIMSVNMYPGVSGRVTQGTTINFCRCGCSAKSSTPLLITRCRCSTKSSTPLFGLVCGYGVQARDQQHNG